MSSETIELLRLLPGWAILAILLYFGILLTIAVIRGQAVEFFPPKIGARTAPSDGLFRGQEKSDELKNLTGQWYVYFGFDTSRTSVKASGMAEITAAKANDFKMTLNLDRSKLGRVIHNVFEYEGKIKNRQVLTTFRSASSLGGYMVGTMVMFPNPQGDKIFCGATYINRSNKIIMDECLLMRH